ncbi:MAG: complex I NDUFA9 subunit family protein [Alphaproteobacteria bacterium]
MAEIDVAIFGGTGFLGRRIAARLLERGASVRAAVRHPDRVEPPPGAPGRLEAVKADVQNTDSVEEAVRGARAVVNAVSLYVEGHGASFRSVHVEGARRVARTAQSLGTEHLLHISGIGSDPAAPSHYERCRGEGENAVRTAFSGATIFRPSAMFGPDDAFLSNLVQLLKRFPAFALFGRGKTRLQPVYVEDVAEAAANALSGKRRVEPVYELGGPTIFTYRGLVERIMDVTGYRRPLVPFPFAGWEALVTAASALPSPPLTRSQLALMKHDSVASPDLPGLRSLGVQPTDLETVLQKFFTRPPRAER